MPPASHILCIHLPRWPIIRRFRRRPEFLARRVAVIQSAGQRRRVIDVSPQAAAQGVCIGISAAEAQGICPDLHCIDEDPAGDRRALEALGRWLIRFTPIVACGWDDALPDAIPAVLFLDLTGCERLFGGFDRLVDLIKSALARFGIPAQMALAPTPGAAWAFASTGLCLSTISDHPSLLGALSLLPIESLRLHETLIQSLHLLGLHHAGDLLALPREQLPSRFGPTLLKRLDQLTGASIEPLTKLVNDPPVSARMEFDAPVESLEDIRRIFEKLLGHVAGDLARRKRGARELRLKLKPDRGWGLSPITRTIALSRAHFDKATLLNLIHCETDRVNCEHGFVRFELDVPLHEPICEGQTQLFQQQAVEEEIEFDRLLQRLRGRLGESAVIRPQLVESYLPERAWRPAADDAPAAVIAKSPPRPLTLFPTPIEIRVVCEPSDDRTGRPRQFTWLGNIHHLTHAIGPERIAGEWWRGHRHTRDYYDAEDDAGRRFWLFRVLHTHRDDAIVARWFLHGRFD